MGIQILTVDIGTGTQDIYLYRAGLSLENGFKLVMPSPTMLVRQRIRRATARGQAILLEGVMMGGGPCHWAAEEHLRAGLPLYATPAAARTFNDDLQWVEQEMGVRIVSAEEARNLADVERIPLLDFDWSAIRAAFAAFGVELKLQALAVAVFDHGAAPPQISDRQFRFDYLKERLQAERRLTALAFRRQDIPPAMTRLQAVAQCAPPEIPLVVMDTAPAAVLGATLDPAAQAARLLVANVGNFHTLAFRLGPTGVEGVFEHHTGLLDPQRLEGLLRALADGSLTHAQVFNDHGHGALILHPEPLPLGPEGAPLVVTGPRRAMLRGSGLRPHFAVPFGDMMLTGCFGLLLAVAERLPQFAPAIRASLEGRDDGVAPWDAR